jgi:hypothetical protein
MTLPTKILLALIVVLAAGSVFADVAAKNEDSGKFSASPSVSQIDSADQSELNVREEVAETQSEAGHCTLQCHPVMAPAKLSVQARHLRAVARFNAAPEVAH